MHLCYYHVTYMTRHPYLLDPNCVLCQAVDAGFISLRHVELSARFARNGLFVFATSDRTIIDMER